MQAGCGGISLMGGAFSFINVEQFTQSQSSTGRAGLLTSKTFTESSPEVTNRASVLMKQPEMPT